MSYYVYILKCADGSLYTGIATDVKRRLREHNGNQKKASKYVWARRPFKLVYKEESTDRSAATKRELEMKGWNRKQKEDFIQGAKK